MELTIKYNHGVMTINVDKFLCGTNLKDFKKLLKIIDASYTPEVRDVLKDYMTGYLQSVDDKIKGYKREIYAMRIEEIDQISILCMLEDERDNWKRTTGQYKSCMEKVKVQREKIRAIKNERKYLEIGVNRMLKNKAFYTKCLKLL